MIAHLIERIKLDFCNNNSGHWSDNIYRLIYIYEPSDHFSMKNIHFCLSNKWISGFCIKKYSIGYDNNSFNFRYYERNMYINIGGIIDGIDIF